MELNSLKPKSLHICTLYGTLQYVHNTPVPKHVWPVGVQRVHQRVAEAARQGGGGAQEAQGKAGQEEGDQVLYRAELGT